jgi:hypothetical protein
MRRIASPVLALIVLAAAGCGGGPRVTEQRDVGSFDRLEVSGSLEVHVLPGDSGRVAVTGGEDVIDRVRTDVSGGVLHVHIADHGIVIGPDPFDDVIVQLPAGALDGVRIDGAGDVTLTNLDADALDVEVDGGGDIEATGTVDSLVATIEGSGDASLSGLAARRATVTVQGSGDAELNVADALTVTVQSSGDVSYRGDPRVRSVVEGSGDLRREGG